MTHVGCARWPSVIADDLALIEFEQDTIASATTIPPAASPRTPSRLPQGSRRARLADRPPPRGVRPVPGVRLAERRATRSGGGPTSAASSSTHFAPPDSGRAVRRGRAAFDAALETPQLALRHRHRARQRRRRPRRPIPAKLGGAVFVDLDQAVKEHPELLRRYLLTKAVTARPTTSSRRCTRRSGPAARCSTCPRA